MPDDGQLCESGAHNLTVAAQYVVVLLDSTSVDAVQFACRSCMLAAVARWASQDDGTGWEVRRLAAVTGPVPRLVPLGDVPLDGSVEVLHAGCDDRGSWLAFTPKHHLAAYREDSSVMVTVRPTP